MAADPGLLAKRTSGYVRESTACKEDFRLCEGINTPEAENSGNTNEKSVRRSLRTKTQKIS